MKASMINAVYMPSLVCSLNPSAWCTRQLLHAVYLKTRKWF